MDVLVSAMRMRATDIVSVELVSVDGSHLPGFDAGAHIDIHLPGQITRQYSLWNHPDERHRYCIGVLKDPASRGGSRTVHEQLRVGQIIQISEPRNLFGLSYSAGRSLLFAGGIGITPMLSMAQRLAQEGRDFELHYCARAQDRAAFVKWLKESAFADRVHFHFDDGPADEKLNLATLLTTPEEDSHLYVCGPSGFMDYVLSSARSEGWLETRLHWEYFAAAPVIKADDGSFEVRINSTGQTLVVAADQSVVQALEDAGICVPVSCEQGICGTCVTRVLDGEPDHRDYFLSEAEHAKNDQFTPCCSRALSHRLVLDL